MNIISNAVKYNKEKGEILLSYYETQVDDRHILFEFHCKDTGVGMSKEFQNHIFSTSFFVIGIPRPVPP